MQPREAAHSKYEPPPPETHGLQWWSNASVEQPVQSKLPISAGDERRRRTHDTVQRTNTAAPDCASTSNGKLEQPTCGQSVLVFQASAGPPAVALCDRIYAPNIQVLNDLKFL